MVRQAWLKVLWHWGCLWASGWAQVINLPCIPNQIALDELNHLYLWCPAERALYKMWAPRYDSVVRIGNVGTTEGFLDVASLAPIANQQLYVLDVGRQKLFLLGTNLQPLQRIDFMDLPAEVARGFPMLLTATPSGELFFVLRETQEIVRVDAFGRLLVRFGGKVAGPARLSWVEALCATHDRLWVYDKAAHQLLAFDLWGNLLAPAYPAPKAATFVALGPQHALFQRGNTLIFLREGVAVHQMDLPDPIRGAYLSQEIAYLVSDQVIEKVALP